VVPLCIGIAATVTAAAMPATRSGIVRWRVLKTFAVKNVALVDVLGFKNGTAWAGGLGHSQTPVLYHLSGGKWHLVSLPGSSGTFVSNLSASSASNVWATLENEPLVARLTPAGWVTTSFANGQDDILFNGVVTTGPTNAWVFIDDYTLSAFYAEHFDGLAWTRVALPAMVNCNCATHEASASSPSNVWTWATTTTGAFVTMRYNGHAWGVVEVPARVLPSGHNVEGQQILAMSASNVWASATDSMAPKAVILLHWNGSAWRKVGGKPPLGPLSGPIASDGSGGVWLVAQNATSSFFLHYARGKWTKYPMVKAGPGTIVLNALRLIAGTRSVLGAGNLDTCCGTTNGGFVVKHGG
jgi:hypothetical protein